MKQYTDIHDLADQLSFDEVMLLVRRKVSNTELADQLTTNSAVDLFELTARLEDEIKE